MRKPGFGIFQLPAILDALAEHAVDIADAIAAGRQIERGEAFHEAGGQPAQAAIAQRRIGFQFLDPAPDRRRVGKRGLHLFRQAQVGQGIAQQPADEEFQAEIIDALGARRVHGAGGCHPPVDHLVAHRQNGCGKPVMGLCGALILRHAVKQRIQ